MFVKLTLEGRLMIGRLDFGVYIMVIIFFSYTMYNVHVIVYVQTQTLRN